MRFLELPEVLEAAWRLPLYERKYKGLRLGAAIAEPDRLPFLEADDLVSDRPAGLIGAGYAAAQVAFFSSGTHGRPKVVFLSAEDLERVVEACAWFCEIEGVEPGARAMLILPLSLWSVGQITLLGLERAGAQVLPVSTQVSRTIWAAAANRFQPNILSSTASVLEDLACMQLHIPRQQIVETTGEPLTSTTRRRLETLFGGSVRDAYGLTECVVGTECAEQAGYHVVPGSVCVEIVSRAGGRVLGPGQPGEIIVTNLMHKLMPIVRYRTGDLGVVEKGPCPCGYPSLRLRVLGRIRETLFLPAGVRITNLEILEVLAPFLDVLMPRPRLWAVRDGRPLGLHLEVPARDPCFPGGTQARKIELELRQRLERASLDVSDLVDCGELAVSRVAVIQPDAEDLRDHRKPLLQVGACR